MTQYKLIRICRALLLTAMVAAMCAIPCQAKKISDASKQKQVSSMEYINWNFEPAIFYGWFHHNYSGAKSKFFGLDYSFHENRSNVKRLCWIRSENLGLNAAQKELMKAERDSLSPIVKEELYRSIDRNVDIYYNDYNKDFEHYREGILDCLEYALKRSRGKYKAIVADYLKSKEGLDEKVKYIHRTGPGHEMESASRKESYEKTLGQMKQLYHCSFLLAQSSIMLYPPVNN